MNPNQPQNQPAPIEPQPVPQPFIEQPSNVATPQNTTPLPSTPNTIPTAVPPNTPPSQQPYASIDPYVSNPFLASVDGLKRILDSNASSILLATFVSYSALAILYALAIVLPIVGILLLIIASIVFFGAYFSIAASSTTGDPIKLSAAIGKSFSKILSLIALGFLLILILSVGFALLIFPGIWLLGRIGLAPLVMFAENLGPIRSISRSFELTKGHVIEILGAYFAGLLLTFGYGLIGPAGQHGPLVERYRGLKQLKESQAGKPQTHWLNYLSLLLPALMILSLVAVFMIAASSGLNRKKNESTQQQTQQVIDTVSNDPQHEALRQYYEENGIDYKNPENYSEQNYFEGSN